MVALYRKWRSRSFADLVGQEHVVRTLRNAVRQHRIAHAYLFTGPRGTGKTSMARILAKAVNCLDPQDGNPCDRCEMCVASNEGRVLDVIEIDAASNTSVDNVRELRERVAYAAGEGRYKVYIIDEVHRLSGAAFDAFLKTLEEPPPHVIFVFASTEPHKVPETIASRCQRFDFRRHTLIDMLGRLTYVCEQEHLRVSEDALRLMALHAHGSLRDALGLLDQVAAYTEGEIDDSDVRSALGLAEATLVGELTECLLKPELGVGLMAFQRFVDGGGDSRQLTRQLVEYWQALLLRATGVRVDEIAYDPALAGFFEEHTRRIGGPRLVAALRALTDQEFGSRFNVPASLAFEVAYVEAGASIQEQSIKLPTFSPPTQQPSGAPPVEERTLKDPVIRQDSPPSPPEPSLPVPPPGASLAGASIETAWDTIVASMRAKSPSLQALLRSGYPMKTQDGEITIGFPYDFHLGRFAEVKNRKMLEQVVAEVTGASYRVSCVRTTLEEIRSLRGPVGAQEDDGFIEEVTERLREFHSRELGNGRS